MSLLKKIEEKKKQQQKMDRNKKIKIATLGVATGALTGAVTGILLAPKSGKETREDIKDASKQVKEKISEKAEQTKDKVKESKVKIKESKVKIKEYLESKKNTSNEEDTLVADTLQLIETTEDIEETKEV